MKNKLALQVAKAAENYRATERSFPEAEKIAQQDYEDLMSIAVMIENCEEAKKIARAMHQLDTAVRDVIPDEPYYYFTELYV